MGELVAQTGDNPNGLKEAKELAGYEKHLREKFMIRQYGSKDAARQAMAQGRRR